MRQTSKYSTRKAESDKKETNSVDGADCDLLSQRGDEIA
jgi:hypothetical protein